MRREFKKCKKRCVDIPKHEIVSLVSQTGDEYFALLLIPYEGANNIVIGRGVSEVEAHEQLVSKLARPIAAKPKMAKQIAKRAQDEAEDE